MSRSVVPLVTGRWRNPLPGSWTLPQRCSRAVWRSRVAQIDEAAASFAVRFPRASVATHQINIGDLAHRKFGYVTTWTDPFAASVTISRGALQDPIFDELLAERHEDGAFAFGSVFGLCWHEFGHALCDGLVYDQLATGQSLEEGYEDLVYALLAPAGRSRERASMLSAAASRSSSELCAESVADAVLWPSVASSFSRVLMGRLERFWAP